MSERFDIDAEVARLMTQVQEQQDQIVGVQQELIATQIVGSVERGAITVTMNGGGRFTAVTIEPDAVRQFHAQDLGTLVLQAIMDAMRQLADLTRERYGPLMEDPSALDDAITYYAPPDQPPYPR